MLRNETVMRLYNNVMNYDMLSYNIPIEAVRAGIKTMTEVYKPDNSSLESKASNLADFNNAAYRCAYLHKYAAFHTSMVYDMMFEAVKTNFNLFYDIVFSTNRFQLVTLGGGPGTDVIGVLAALHSAFSYFPTSVAVVDCMVNWSYSFRSILRELGSGSYGAFGNNIYQYLDWRYIYADLLQSLTPEVNDALSSASLVTMIKFASAAACVETKNMVENIFTAMKPGAVLLFIDNDGGGYRQLIMKAASEHGFISLFGPITQENYENGAMKIKRFGHVSCFKSRVAIHVLQKPWSDRYNRPVENFYSPLLDIPLTRYAPSVPLLGNTQSPYAPSVPFFNDALPSYTPVSHFENPSSFYPPVQFNNPVTPHQLFGTFDFAQDYPCNDNAVLDIPQRPSHWGPPFVNTPISTINSPFGLENIQPPAIYTEKGITRSKKGLKKFRKRLRQKLNNVKSQASSFFKKLKVEKVASTCLPPKSSKVKNVTSTSLPPKSNELVKVTSTSLPPKSNEVVKVASTSLPPKTNEVERVASTSLPPKTNEVNKITSTLSPPKTNEVEKVTFTSFPPNTNEVEIITSTSLPPKTNEETKSSAS